MIQRSTIVFIGSGFCAFFKCLILSLVVWRSEKTEYLKITCSWFSVWGLRPSCPCLKCQYHKSSKGLLLTISIMSGGITSGSMSWICRTCLLYSSFIVLNSVRQASILGYSRLEAQRKTSMRGFRLTEWTESNTLCFTHCFSGPVLLQSIQVFSVSARFSWSSSIMACCCTPGRSDRSNKNNYLRIQSNLSPRTSENTFIFYVFMAHCLEGLKNLTGFHKWLISKDWDEGPAGTWRKQGHGLHENILFVLQAQIAQSVVKFEQRLKQERLEARYKTQVNRGQWHEMVRLGKQWLMQHYQKNSPLYTTHSSSLSKHCAYIAHKATRPLTFRWIHSS